MISKTPSPPYYAVIFTSTTQEKTDGYEDMSIKMKELAEIYPGYLGFESVRAEIGITISYWKDLDSIKNWRNNLGHLLAQELGKKKWYKNYSIRVARVERDYHF